MGGFSIWDAEIHCCSFGLYLGNNAEITHLPAEPSATTIIADFIKILYRSCCWWLHYGRHSFRTEKDKFLSLQAQDLAGTRAVGEDWKFTRYFVWGPLSLEKWTSVFPVSVPEY